MVRDGLDEATAARQVWIVDLPGLLTDDMGDGMLDYQRPYARSAAETAGWTRTPVQVDPSVAIRWPQMAAPRQARAASGIITLETVVGHVKPTVLIGASTAHGAFTQQVVETVSAGVERPAIFPISNPASRIEAMPADIVAWSRGKALVATACRSAGGLRGRALPVRTGQQCPAVPRARPWHDHVGRVQGHRRHAACGRRGRGGPGRRQRTGCLAAAGGENLRPSSATTAIAVGQEWSGYARAFDDAIAEVEHATAGLLVLAMGGTAVGTGLNAPPGFGDQVAVQVAQMTGAAYVSAPNKFTARAR
jgi:Malic enzyme, NAD binding domain/Lyase